jgi:SAM-dependent methyltransferase
MRIGNVELNLKYYKGTDVYSDGGIEDELLEIIKTGKIEEALENDTRWPILYYLSDIRKNILSWYQFKENASLLEIGTGLGAVTGLFCERCQSVKGIESSKRRATITAYRNAAYENLSIQAGNFLDMEFEEKYDYITLIGVLEYAPMFMAAGNGVNDFLKQCQKLLKTNGQLIIAIENRLGIKYWAGAPEDHTGQIFEGIENYQIDSKVRTFSRNELKNMLEASGFNNLTWYYPYPDYKIPLQIFSDSFLPKSAMLYADICAYDQERLSMFDEKKAIQAIADDGNFSSFANSFLVFCGKGISND